jgi:hypothetical protein
MNKQPSSNDKKQDMSNDKKQDMSKSKQQTQQESSRDPSRQPQVGDRGGSGHQPSGGPNPGQQHGGRDWDER